MNDRDSIRKSIGEIVAMNQQEVLWIGIGNDGRCDDGLGWAFLKELNSSGADHRTIFRYQLQIEDAEMISHARHVVFVDACRIPLTNGFELQRCLPVADVEYTSHQLSPQTVLFLCQQLYDKTPSADLLLIEGVQWDLRIGLSDCARVNLAAAVDCFVEKWGARKTGPRSSWNSLTN